MTSIFEGPEKWIAEARLKIQSSIVNATFDEMARRHPKKFPEAFKWLTSLDPKNEKARKTVQRIFDSEHPGAALMAWYDAKCDRPRIMKLLKKELTNKRKRAHD